MSSPTDRLTAALADRYRIEREVGRGGMATVFLAHDLKHDREVAIKVLNPELGAVLGVDRFLTEIRTTARFQHPNILPLFDSGAEAGVVFYVMPYIEGETLRDRIVREGQLAVDDVLRIARGVASALDYAHKRGVIHRDIKPENILLQDGQPLVADFGIALAISNAGGARVTQTGISVGTPQYMSPEQAAAERQLDGRSDQYALASVVYELLVGEPPFTGPSAPVVMSRLMTEVPRAVNTRRISVPASASNAIARALSKVPADRYVSATAFVDAMESSATPAVGEGASRAPRASRIALASMAALTVASISVAGWSWMHRPTEAASGAYRYSVEVSDNSRDQLAAMAISPDGRRVAITITDSSGVSSLWIRPLDSLSGSRVPGSEKAMAPFFSPDGLQLGFFTDRRLMRVDVRGGTPTPIASVTAPSQMAKAIWMAEDQIIFVATTGGPLFRVSARGGDVPVAYTTHDSTEALLTHMAPVRLSDNRHFLYRVRRVDRRSIARDGIVFEDSTMLASIDSPQPTFMTNLAIAGVSGNALLFLRDGEIRALPFDPDARKITGDPVTIVSGDTVRSLEASDNGVIVYGIAARSSGSSLVWLDRTGRVTGQIGQHADGVGFDFYGPRVSPDGRLVAYEYHEGRGTGDLFFYDRRTSTSSQQTFDPTHHNAFVAWSDDSRQLVFHSTRSGGDLFLKTLDGTAEKKIPHNVSMGFPSDWSPDGRDVLVSTRSPNTGFDVLRTTPAGGTPEPVLQSPAHEMQAVLSPDGHWIAYASDEQGGRSEVYVRRYPITAEQWKVSNSGGEGPRWRRDGKELFFLATTPSGAVMSVPTTLGANFSFSAPQMLFRRPIKMGSNATRAGVNYDILPDGSQFVAVVQDSTVQTRAPMLRVFANWPAVRPLQTR